MADQAATLADTIISAAEEAKPNPKKKLELAGEVNGEIAAAAREALEEYNEAADVEEVGRRFSKASASEIQKAIDALQALLPTADDTPDTDTQSDDSDEHTERAGNDELTEAVIKAARSATEKTVKRELKEFKKQLRDEFYTLRRKNRVEEDDEAPATLRKSAKIAESASDKPLEEQIGEMSLAEMLKTVLISTQNI